PPWQRAFAIELSRRSAFQPLEIPLSPILLGIATARLLAFQILLGAQQYGVARVFGNRIVLLFPSQYLHVVFVREGEDVALVVILRTPGAAEDLMGGARIHQFLLPVGALDQRTEHDRPRGQVDPGGESLSADRHGEQLPLEKALNRAAIFGQQTGVVHTDAAA